MVEIEDGAVTVAGNSGVVVFDQNYQLTKIQRISGSLGAVRFVRLSNGLGLAGFAIKDYGDEESQAPHLVVLHSNFRQLSEVPLCATCEIANVADFVGDGVDFVVAWGRDIISITDLSTLATLELPKFFNESKLNKIYRSATVDLDCDGREELFFKASLDSVLEHDNEWTLSKYFVLRLNEQIELVEYESFLEKNWKKVRSCSASRVSKDPFGFERYLDGQHVQLSAGNFGIHRTDNPVQNFLHLFNISGAVEQSWEVRTTGMRRALNFYPLLDMNCLDKNENAIDSRSGCSRYLSVYARWGHGCEQFFWENEDCDTWVLLLEPDGTWEQVATWPNWSFASLLTSDGRLLLHSVADLLEIKLPINLVRSKQ